MDEMTIYWITRLDAFKAVFEFINIMSFIISVATEIITFVETANRDILYNTKLLNSLKSITRILFVYIAIFSLICCFMPSTKEMFAIKCIPTIVSKETLKSLKT